MLKKNSEILLDVLECNSKFDIKFFTVNGGGLADFIRKGLKIDVVKHEHEVYKIDEKTNWFCDLCGKNWDSC